jgi:hypothetical protein
MQTHSVAEILDLLLVAHFPNLVVTETMEAPAADQCAKCLDWQVDVRVVKVCKDRHYLTFSLY